MANPLHDCEIVRVQPYILRAKNNSIKPKRLKPKMASETAESGDSTTAQAFNEVDPDEDDNLGLCER